VQCRCGTCGSAEVRALGGGGQRNRRMHRHSDMRGCGCGCEIHTCARTAAEGAPPWSVASAASGCINPARPSSSWFARCAASSCTSGGVGDGGAVASAAAAGGRERKQGEKAAAYLLPLLWQCAVGAGQQDARRLQQRQKIRCHLGRPALCWASSSSCSSSSGSSSCSNSCPHGTRAPQWKWWRWRPSRWQWWWCQQWWQVPHEAHLPALTDGTRMDGSGGSVCVWGGAEERRLGTMHAEGVHTHYNTH
jgi:hypothetical protein